MKRILTIIVCVFFIASSVEAVQTIRLKDADMTTQLSVTSDTSGNVTFAFTAAGPTLDLDDADVLIGGDLTVSGTTTITGTPAWSLSSPQSLDPSSATVYWGMIDASDEEARIYKIDSSHMVLYNDTATDGIAFMSGGDTDDYPYFHTSSNICYLKTAGTQNLWIQPDNSITYISSPDSDATLTIRGYEAKEARLIMSADEDDDATDSFRFDVSTAGALTIGNDQSVADTYVDLFVLSNTGDINMRGTTPALTIGDAGAEDTSIVFDGNAQDFYIGLDDTVDDLFIGLGAAVATTPAISIDENQVVTFYQDEVFGGTTPNITIGDAGAEDAQLSFDGNAQDFSIGIDDTDDTLNIALGTTMGTTERIKVASAALNVIFGDASAADVYNTFDGNAEDFYYGIDDSADDFVIGRGTTVGTDIRLSILDGAAVQHIKIGDAAAEDMILSWDGNAQDYHIALDDSADDLIIGKGTTVATTEYLTFLNDSFLITVGDASAADAGFKIDGNAQDFYVAMDDTDDTLQIGLGGTPGTTERIKFSSAALSATWGDASAADVYNVFDGNADDFYYGIDDSEDDFVIGYGSTVGTDNRITLRDDSTTIVFGDGVDAEDKALIIDGNAQDFYIAYDDSADDLVFGTGATVGTDIRLSILDGAAVQHIKIGDAAEEDMLLSFDGNAQDYYAGLDDSADELVIGLGTTVGTTPAVAIDANRDVEFYENVRIDELNFAADAEASDTYVITLAPAPTAYTTGMMIIFTANTANTGACTINVNALGAKSLKMLHDQDPADNYIESGSVVVAVYDGTNFQLISPDANP